MLIQKYVISESVSDPFIFENKFGSTEPSVAQSMQTPVLMVGKTYFWEYVRNQLLPGRIFSHFFADQLPDLADTV